MGKMILFELKKIWDKKLLIGLMAFLLLASGVLFHLNEKSQPAYTYIYQGRDAYEHFLQGDVSADVYGVYAKDMERQKKHKENYGLFLSEMEERAEKSMLLLGNSERKSYVYTNAKKTCEDYKRLSSVEIINDNCYGVVEFAQYDLGIYLLIGCVGLLAYYVFFEERRSGILLLVKGTKYGHAPLIQAKMFVMVVGSVLFTLLQEGIHICMTEYYYGFGDLTRSIQSVPELRNCPMAISVGEGILFLVMVRVWIAIVISILVSMVSVVVRNEFLAILTLVVCFGAELAFEQSLLLTERLNFFKCINPFFEWNMINVLGTYLNLNIFGNAVGKEWVAVVVSMIVVMICIVVTERIFHHKYQIRTQSRLDRIALWWRRKTAFLWQNVQLLWFELYKILFQQKRIFLVLLMMLICIMQANTYDDIRYYDNAYEASYNSYMKKISGKVTEESLTFIESEQAYVNDLQIRLDALEDPEGKDYGLALQLENELKLKREAVNKMVMQYKTLRELSGSIYNKYFINEEEYFALFYDVRSHGIWWFICMSAIVFWLSGVFSADRKQSVYTLIQTTVNGKKRLDEYKKGTVVLGGVIFFISIELLKIVEIYQIDGFQCMGKPLSEFINVQITSDMTIGTFLVVAALLRAATMTMMTIFVVWLSKKTSSEMITNIVGIGMAGVIAVVCIQLGFSMSAWMLNLMYV